MDNNPIQCCALKKVAKYYTQCFINFKAFKIPIVCVCMLGNDKCQI